MNYYDVNLSADLTRDALADWSALMGDTIIPEDIPKPRTFAELIANYCLVKSECLWNETSKLMVEQLNFSTATLLYCQENIFDYYCSHGYSQAEAWSKMHRLSGGHVYPDHTVEMAYSKDCWMLDQMSRISGCIPRKADTIETILTALRKRICVS